MAFSQVSVGQSLKVKKRFYVSEIDEYSGSSEPLNDIVLSNILNVVPSKSSNKRLKSGYIVDLTREGGLSPCAIILGLLYIKRLSQANPAYFTTLSSRELFLVSMLVASKYLNDEGEMEGLTNTDFSAIGFTPRSRLDHLEIKFLEAIDWRLFVSLEEYYQFVTSVEGRVALNQACQRGWFSYTDLCTVWEATNTAEGMLSASKTTAKVACGSALLYLVCVATLFASTPQPSNNLSTFTASTDDSTQNLTLFEPDSTFDLSQSGTHPVFSTKPPDLEPLRNTTAILSLGKRCTGESHSFIEATELAWSPGVLPLPATGHKEESATMCAAVLDMDWSTIDIPCNDGFVENGTHLDKGVDSGGGHLESGLLLLLNLTVALTSPDFLTPEQPSDFNPLTTKLLNPDGLSWNSTEIESFYQSANVFDHDHRMNFRPVISKCEMCRQPSAEFDYPKYAEKWDQSKSPDHQNTNHGFDTRDLQLDELEYEISEHFPSRSPVIVMEMVPVVTASPLWGSGIPLTIERHNFTLMQALGMFAESVLAW